MIRRANHTSRQKVTHDHARPDKLLYAWGLTALVHSVKAEGMSQRQAARAMRVALSTASDAITGKRPVNPYHVLRSKRLARHFLICLAKLERESRRA